MVLETIRLVRWAPQGMSFILLGSPLLTDISLHAVNFINYKNFQVFYSGVAKERAPVEGLKASGFLHVFWMQ